MELILKKDGALAVVRSLGGELISYKKDGKEYVWTGDENTGRDALPRSFRLSARSRTERLK